MMKTQKSLFGCEEKGTRVLTQVHLVGILFQSSELKCEPSDSDRANIRTLMIATCVGSHAVRCPLGRSRSTSDTTTLQECRGCHTGWASARLA